MRKILKSILGESLVFKLRTVKNKIFPNEYYRNELKSLEKCREFYSSFVHKGDLCFDIGANMGNKTEPLLDLKATVIAVEPQKSCQKILKIKFKNKITLIPKGLGEKEEVKEFYISDASTISSFSREWIDSVKQERFKDHNWNKTEQIQITTLDKLIEKYGTPVFIKIDVEGYELEVLKGLSKPVGMISFEYTIPEQKERLFDCINKIYSINPNIECNYSVSDSMLFSLDKWVSYYDMIKLMKEDSFIKTGYGDVYVRSRK